MKLPLPNSNWARGQLRVWFCLSEICMMVNVTSLEDTRWRWTYQKMWNHTYVDTPQKKHPCSKTIPLQRNVFTTYNKDAMKPRKEVKLPYFAHDDDEATTTTTF